MRESTQEKWSNSVSEVHYAPIGDMKRPLPTVLPSTWKCWRKRVRCTFLIPPDVLDEENLAICLTQRTESKGSWWSGGEAGGQVSDGTPAEQAAPANRLLSKEEALRLLQIADLRLRSTHPWVAEACHRAANCPSNAGWIHQNVLE